MQRNMLTVTLAALLVIVGVQKVADYGSSTNRSARFVTCKIENGKRFFGLTSAERRTTVCRVGKQFASRTRAVRKA